MVNIWTKLERGRGDEECGRKNKVCYRQRPILELETVFLLSDQRYPISSQVCIFDLCSFSSLSFPSPCDMPLLPTSCSFYFSSVFSQQPPVYPSLSVMSCSSSSPSYTCLWEQSFHRMYLLIVISHSLCSKVFHSSIACKIESKFIIHTFKVSFIIISIIYSSVIYFFYAISLCKPYPFFETSQIIIGNIY